MSPQRINVGQLQLLMTFLLENLFQWGGGCILVVVCLEIGKQQQSSGHTVASASADPDESI